MTIKKKFLADPIGELVMAECLALGWKGAGYVSPNPMVGAILIKGTEVIGRGYHQKFGGAHAEVHAIRNANRSTTGATLYVNLEPCNHFGKTPPCTEAIIAAGIKHVVVGMKDPNPLVAGSGIRKLRSAGIQVDVGVLEDECKKFNEAFLKYIVSRIPFVTLKIAQTFDGNIADSSGRSRWITNEHSRTYVHRLRSHYDAVLVGAKTIIYDDPLLTVRAMKGRNPVRVIVSKKLSVPIQANIFRTAKQITTILCTSNEQLKRNPRKVNALRARGVEIIGVLSVASNRLSLKEMMKKLASLGIISILVEGGAETYAAFIEQRMADKLQCFISPKILGKGLGAFDQLSKRMLGRAIQLHNMSMQSIHGDYMIEAYLQK